MLNSSWVGGLGAYGAPYGEGQGPVLLKYFRCNGSEQSLFECGPDISGKHNECQHVNDVGVVCLPEPPKGALSRAGWHRMLVQASCCSANSAS